MKFNKIFCIVGLLFFFGVINTAAVFAQAESKPTSSAYGTYHAHNARVLSPSFKNAINNYLQKHSPRLVSERTNYIEMSAIYNYQLKIELIIKPNTTEYEIAVTIAQDNYDPARAQNVCVTVAQRANRHFINQYNRAIR